MFFVQCLAKTLVFAQFSPCCKMSCLDAKRTKTLYFTMFLLPERSKKSSKTRSNRCLNWQETSSKLESSSLQNIAFATPKHHAIEGRTYASKPPSLQNPGFAACFSMSCWLLPLSSCLLPLTLFCAFCAFYLLAPSLFPSSLTHSPCCRQGSADMYVYIKC